MVALQHLTESAAPPPDVATARAEVDRLRDGLPDTLLALRPEEIRRLARRALDAEKAALRRRSKVGDEPVLDEVATVEAMAAHDAVCAARRGEREALTDSMRWLAIGNVWGLGGLVLAGGLVIRGGFEPMAAPVYYAVVGAAAGPLSTTVLGLTRRSFASMRVSAAVASWAQALAAAGCETMGELHARRLSRAGWQRRSAEAAAANAVARDARAAWHRVAGPNRHPRQAPALIAQMTVLRAAQIDLLRALIAERMRPRELARRAEAFGPDTEPIAIVDVADEPVPFDVVWAVPAPVVDVTDDVTDDGERAGVWSRLRGRTARIWSR